MSRAPLVMMPAPEATRLPVRVSACRSSCVESTTVMLARFAPTKPTVPLNALPALPSKMLAPAPLAVNTLLPSMSSTPLVASMLPAVAVALRLPVRVMLPSVRPSVSTTVALAPLVTRTAAAKLLPAWSSVTLLPAPGVNVAMPVTSRLPLSVMLPLAVTPSVPLTVEPPRSMAPVALRVTFLPEAMDTVLPRLLSLSSVMSLPLPAVSVVVPVMFRLPLSVMAPFVVTARLPLTVEAPRMSALVSVIVTLLPDAMATVLKLLLVLLSVMLLLAPAASVVTPVTLRAPSSVMAPSAVTPRVPLMVDVLSSMSSVSVIETLRPDETSSLPKSLLVSSRVMLLPAPALSVVVPPMLRVPLSVMPAPLAVRLPLIDRACRSRVVVSATATSASPPAPAKLTVPSKMLPALSTAMLAPAASAVNEALPPMSSTPAAPAVLAMLPSAAVASRLPVMTMLPRVRPSASTMVTLAPLVTETAPPKLLPTLVSVRLLPAPGVNVAVPSMSRAFDAVMPLAVTARLPVMSRAWSVRAEVSARVTLASLPAVTASVTVPVKSLLVLPSVMLEPPAAVNELLPSTFRMALPEMLPASTTTVRFWPAVTAPSTSALSSRMLMSLAPELLSVTAPPKLLSVSFKVMALAPAENDDVPVTISSPVCVIAPPARMSRLPDRVSVGRAMAFCA